MKTIATAATITVTTTFDDHVQIHAVNDNLMVSVAFFLLRRCVFLIDWLIDRLCCSLTGSGKKLKVKQTKQQNNSWRCSWQRVVFSDVPLMLCKLWHLLLLWHLQAMQLEVPVILTVSRKRGEVPTNAKATTFVVEEAELVCFTAPPLQSYARERRVKNSHSPHSRSTKTETVCAGSEVSTATASRTFNVLQRNENNGN